MVNGQNAYIIPQPIQMPNRVSQGENHSSNRSRLSQDVMIQKLSPNFALGNPIKITPQVKITYGSNPISN